MLEYSYDASGFDLPVMSAGGYETETPLSGMSDWSNWSLYTNDAQEQSRMGAAYPDNGQTWDMNAAAMGVSRLIDTATRAYVNVKGAQAATYAGQNGQTYTTGTAAKPEAGSSGLLPLVLVGALVALML